MRKLEKGVSKEETGMVRVKSSADTHSFECYVQYNMPNALCRYARATTVGVKECDLQMRDLPWMLVAHLQALRSF